MVAYLSGGKSSLEFLVKTLVTSEVDLSLFRVDGFKSLLEFYVKEDEDLTFFIPRTFRRSRGT